MTQKFELYITFHEEGRESLAIVTAEERDASGESQLSISYEDARVIDADYLNLRYEDWLNRYCRSNNSTPLEFSVENLGCPTTAEWYQHLGIPFDEDCDYWGETVTRNIRRRDTNPDLVDSRWTAHKFSEILNDPVLSSVILDFSFAVWRR